MKLIRLKLGEDFRSLKKGFEINFQTEWNRSEIEKVESQPFAPYVLAGKNGSGKSNLLELLAAIFFHMESLYLDKKPESFVYDEEINPNGFRGAKALPDAFELEYLIPLKEGNQLQIEYEPAHVSIIKKKGKDPKWEILNDFAVNLEDKIKIGRTLARELLPEYVLGYSSGENEILSLPFFKMRFIQLDEYLDSLKGDLDYNGKPESRHTYLDSAYSQAILICNFLFQDEETLEPFRKEVGVDALRRFRIVLKRRIQLTTEEIQRFPEDLWLDDRNQDELNFLSILDKFEADEDSKQKFEPVINRLKRCATCHYYDEETDSLYLDYWVNEATKEAFNNNFESAIDLFQSLQILLTLNLYSVSDKLKKELYGSDSLYINETIPTLASDERIIRFKNLVLTKQGVNSTTYAKCLSDGEHQFLHTLGLCLLFKDTNSLFLLDEPETHFNPEWRSKFISRIRDCFSGSESRREMLITTHTPFLISDSKREKVLEFKKDEVTNVVSVKHPEYNTFGASVDQIAMVSFDKNETVGGHAMFVINDFERRFSDGENSESLIGEINRELGDSVEKMLLIKTIRDGMKPR